ncbi:putative disease resistance protein [Forsythia ovata]|uniref:Disease resistance protein n=1 Tax=Forsythia ovata TaxID=205694 RepID=A0ABD1QBB0_9LAMI
MECIMRLSSAEEQQSRVHGPFPSLEHLLLHGLRNFIGLFKWEGGGAVAPLLPGIFSQLRQGFANTLHNLRKLDVSCCKEIEEIIGDDDDGGLDINSSVDVTLPRLKILQLLNLPELKSICKGMMICDSIERIQISVKD